MITFPYHVLPPLEMKNCQPILIQNMNVCTHIVNSSLQLICSLIDFTVVAYASGAQQVIGRKRQIIEFNNYNWHLPTSTHKNVLSISNQTRNILRGIYENDLQLCIMWRLNFLSNPIPDMQYSNRFCCRSKLLMVMTWKRRYLSLSGFLFLVCLLSLPSLCSLDPEAVVFYNLLVSHAQCFFENPKFTPELGLWHLQSSISRWLKEFLRDWPCSKTLMSIF